MDLIAGVVAGAVVGWIALAVLGGEKERGALPSLGIGIVGGVIGVQLAAMMAAGETSVAGDARFNLFSLVVATACAIGCIIIGNMVSRRRSG